jgi:hypothetical protein
MMLHLRLTKHGFCTFMQRYFHVLFHTLTITDIALLQVISEFKKKMLNVNIKYQRQHLKNLLN